MHCIVAGLVISRQRPDTAKGVVFLSIEDETGITNIIIAPPLFEKRAREVMTGSALLVKGTLRKIGPVVYCNANEIIDVSALVECALGKGDSVRRGLNQKKLNLPH
jgi:error-prone DNA polymerase